jgi:hypothetical protein
MPGFDDELLNVFFGVAGQALPPSISRDRIRRQINERRPLVAPSFDLSHVAPRMLGSVTLAPACQGEAFSARHRVHLGRVFSPCFDRVRKFLHLLGRNFERFAEALNRSECRQLSPVLNAQDRLVADSSQSRERFRAV